MKTMKKADKEDKKDAAMDKKMGIKEGSAKDEKKDGIVMKKKTAKKK